jgi:hypothetical protein
MEEEKSEKKESEKKPSEKAEWSSKNGP